MRTKQWALGCALVLGCTVMVQVREEAPSSAYVFFHTKKAPVQNWRWWKRAGPLPFHVAQVTPQEVPLDQVPTIMQNAFDAWTDLPCGLVPEVYYAGPVTTTKTTEPADTSIPADNIIVFVQSSAEWGALRHSQSELAITKVFADPDTGEIVDADMEINDAGFKFTISDAPDQAGEVDYIGTMVHEAGHFFGMDHSLTTTATMFVSYIAATPTDAHPQRSLEQDDIDGVCLLYKDAPAHVDPGTGGGGLDSGTCAGGGEAGTMLTLVTSLMLLARRRSRSRA